MRRVNAGSTNPKLVRLVVGAPKASTSTRCRRLPDDKKKKKKQFEWHHPDPLQGIGKVLESIPIRHISYTGTDPKSKSLMVFCSYRNSATYL